MSLVIKAVSPEANESKGFSWENSYFSYIFMQERPVLRCRGAHILEYAQFQHASSYHISHLKNGDWEYLWVENLVLKRTHFILVHLNGSGQGDLAI